MPTYSTPLRLKLLIDGEEPTTWGQSTNTNLSTVLENAITGVKTLSPGDVNYTLTALNAAADDAKNAVLVFTGARTAIRTITAPNVNKQYTIKNSTTGGFGLTISSGAGATVTIPNGATTQVYCDGSTGFYVVSSTIPITNTAMNSTKLTGLTAGTTAGDSVEYAQMSAATRIRLTGNLTIYVATTGNDSPNTGLTVGSPFLTIQHAGDTLYNSYDLAGYTATIQVADGTYTGGLSIIGSIVGANGATQVVLNGNSGTPANVIISTTSTNCVSSSYGASITVQNCKLQTTTSGNCLSASSDGQITSGAGLIFGACATHHLFATTGGYITASSNYTITGGAIRHWSSTIISLIVITGKTITLTGTPAFSAEFARASELSELYVFGNTFVGAATGTRYTGVYNSIINTNGGGATYLPGNVAGAVSTGAIYI